MQLCKFFVMIHITCVNTSVLNIYLFAHFSFCVYMYKHSALIGKTFVLIFSDSFSCICYGIFFKGGTFFKGTKLIYKSVIVFLLFPILFLYKLYGQSPHKRKKV